MRMTRVVVGPHWTAGTVSTSIGDSQTRRLAAWNAATGSRPKAAALSAAARAFSFSAAQSKTVTLHPHAAGPLADQWALMAREGGTPLQPLSNAEAYESGWGVHKSISTVCSCCCDCGGDDGDASCGWGAVQFGAVGGNVQEIVRFDVGGAGLGRAAQPWLSKASVTVFQKLQTALLQSSTSTPDGIVNVIGLERSLTSRELWPISPAFPNFRRVTDRFAS